MTKKSKFYNIDVRTTAGGAKLSKFHPLVTFENFNIILCLRKAVKLLLSN